MRKLNKKLNENKELARKVKKIINVKKYQVVCFFLDVLLTLSLVILSFCLKNIIDCISNGESIATNNIIMIIVAFIFYFLSYYFGPILYKHLYANAEKRLNFYVFETTVKQNQEFFVKYDQGYIETIIEDVTSEVSDHYASFTIKFLCDFITVVCYFAIMFYYSWQLTIVTIIILVIVMLLTSRVVNKQAEIVKDCKTGQSKFRTSILETMENVNLIKMIDKTDYYTKEYKNIYSNNFYKPYLKYRILGAIYTTLYAVILFIMPLFILIIGLVLKDVFMISLGSSISVYSLLGNLQEPIRDLSALTSDKKQNSENVKLLKDFMDFDCNNNLKKIESFESLEFKSSGIKFDNNEILKNVSFNIEKNDFVLLRGASGSGKSTIFKHIMKTDSNKAISVTLNGDNISEYNIYPDMLLIQQKNNLFTTTILDNIKCGYDATKEELEEVYNVCMLNEFINKYGESKEIDNISSNISGGEIQRICIARILLRKPKVLLMDEITSALDSQTTKDVAKNIYDFAKKYNITVIAISHKNEFDEYANKVIEL